MTAGHSVAIRQGRSKDESRSVAARWSLVVSRPQKIRVVAQVYSRLASAKVGCQPMVCPRSYMKPAVLPGRYCRQKGKKQDAALLALNHHPNPVHHASPHWARQTCSDGFGPAAIFFECFGHGSNSGPGLHSAHDSRSGQYQH
jgi:hypothetical protein